MGRASIWPTVYHGILVRTGFQQCSVWNTYRAVSPSSRFPELVPENKKMPSISSASLAIAILVAGYLSALCTTPPNHSPDQSKRYRSDRAGILAGTFPWVVKHVQIVVFAYHALVALLYPAEDKSQLDSICPHTENLPPALFTWNERMYKVLFVIFLGAFTRLSAYGGLGRNFTFHLSNPDHLVTDGVYKYLQHPSYTGAALVTFGMAGLLMRWDTAAGACWMQPSTLAMLNGYGWLFTAAWGIFLLSVLGVRVRDEETMLREQFGTEWEKWHAKTKRFIPFVV